MRMLRFTLVAVSATLLTAGSNPHYVVEGRALPLSTAAFGGSYAGGPCVRLHFTASKHVEIQSIHMSYNGAVIFSNVDATEANRFLRANPLPGPETYTVVVFNTDTKPHSVRVSAFDADCGG